MEDIIRKLSSRSTRVASNAIRDLTSTKKKRYAPLMLNILTGPREDLWVEAGKSLSLLSSKKTLPGIIDVLLTSEEKMQREMAAYALSFHDTFNDNRTAEELTVILLKVYSNQDETPSIRGQAAEGLGNINDFIDKRWKRYSTIEQELKKGLNNSNTEIRFWSVFALTKIRSRSALPKLKKLAKEDKKVLRGWWSISREASWAIEQIEGR